MKKHKCMDCIGADEWTRAACIVMGYACERCGAFEDELKSGHCEVCYDDGYRSSQE